jgi:CO/xanthine dehydrogenase Mo-binding subunit
MKMPPSAGARQDAGKEVGQTRPRASAVLKVSGAPIFPSDVHAEGVVHAVLLRSVIARGRVVVFDPTPALGVPGVLAVHGPFSGEQMPGIAYRSDASIRTRPVIDAEVRFVGEEIGVIVAESECAARKAARLVRVKYEKMRALVAFEDPGDPAAPTLLPVGSVAPELDEVMEHGDLRAAEAAADVVVEASYHTSAQHHNPLEPHGCVALWDSDTLILHDGNQGGFLIRDQLARTLDLDLGKVRICSAYTGGGFGSKINLKPFHVIASLMARKLQRPVRLFMSRQEEFVASHHRAPTKRHIRIGGSRDGRIRFVDTDVIGQAGPSVFFARNAAGAVNGLRLHKTDAVRARIRRVLTNTQAPLPFRGPATAEDIFCLEQAVDELAHALGQDPLAFRRANLVKSDLFSGLPFAGNELATCYDEGASLFNWNWRPPRSCINGDYAVGTGMGAAVYDATLYEESQAAMVLDAGGAFRLRVGITEIGCGADTIFPQIAAEELGIPSSSVKVELGDTLTLPRSIDSTNHSRTTAVVGPAVRAASRKLRAELLRAGAEKLQASTEPVSIGPHGVFLARNPSRQITFSSLGALTGGIAVNAERETGPEGVFPAMFAAHFVMVEVHLPIGRIRLRRAVCAHDAGRIVNPRLAESQVHGGFLQGMGMALQEERVMDLRSGRQMNASMWAYRTPSIFDAPLRIDFVDAGGFDAANSLGVKGIGEPPLIAAGAAIANAVFNAIGARVRGYPMTPDRVLAAIRRG